MRLPQAHRENLLVREVGDETVIYDRRRHRAHCLNRVAALVWRHCDGQTTAQAMATLLHQQFGIPTDDQVVWLAVARLERARLLEAHGEGRAAAPPRSRRDLTRRLRVADALAPLICSIVAPKQRAVRFLCPSDPNGPPEYGRRNLANGATTMQLERTNGAHTAHR